MCIYRVKSFTCGHIRPIKHYMALCCWAPDCADETHDRAYDLIRPLCNACIIAVENSKPEAVAREP